MKRSPLAIVFLLAFQLVSQSARAAAVQAADIGHLTRNAHFILRGVPVTREAKPVTTPLGFQRTATTWTFEVAEVLKVDPAVVKAAPAAGDTIDFKMLRGHFTIGKPVVVFLRNVGPYWAVVGEMPQGVLTEQADGTFLNETRNQYLLHEGAKPSPVTKSGVAKDARAEMDARGGGLTVETLKGLIQSVEGDE